MTERRKEKLVKVYGDGALKGQAISYVKDLKIPDWVDASNNQYCKAVQISYEVYVRAESYGCHNNFKVKIPVTIGAVPLNIDPDQIVDSAVLKNIQLTFQDNKLHGDYTPNVKISTNIKK